MIISGVDGYIASWFKALQKIQKALRANLLIFRNCNHNGYFPEYYVYSVSNSGGTITVILVTEYSAVPEYAIEGILCYGIYNQPNSCVFAYSGVRPILPISALQFVVVFNV